MSNQEIDEDRLRFNKEIKIVLKDGKEYCGFCNAEIKRNDKRKDSNVFDYNLRTCCYQGYYTEFKKLLDVTGSYIAKHSNEEFYNETMEERKKLFYRRIEELFGIKEK